jgi:hypothetical protein
MKNEERWWKLIETAFPSVERLVLALRVLSREELVSFGAHVTDLRYAVREPWNGPDIPGVGVLSEDSTEDLTDWIVSQGREYCERAEGSDDAHLAECFALYYAVRTPGHPRAWQPRAIPSLMGTLYNVWCERFDGDEFHAAIDRG